MNQSKFYIGFDIGDEFSQMSYYDEQTNEPESICQVNNQETFLLPNVVFYSENDDGWYVGEEAYEHQKNEGGTLYDHIISQLPINHLIIIGNKKYSYNDLFIIMIKGHINNFLLRFENANIEKIIFTMENTSPEMINALQIFYENSDFTSSQMDIIGHTNSYLNYVLNQSKEIWNNSVGLFDYSEAGLLYYQINFARRHRPMLIEIIHKDYSDRLSDSMLTELDQEELDNIFKGISTDAIGNSFLSAVFLTGKGFMEDWPKESVKLLCSGRRVFLGQNIYTKGACYAAKKDVCDIDNYVIKSDDIIPYNIGVKANGNEIFEIVKGGKEWFNMYGDINVFLDDTNKIDLIYINRLNNEKICETVQIHGLPKRPPKTTKLELSVEFYDQKVGAIVIRDKGFGKLYPTTNKIYRKEFKVVEE